MRHLPIDEAYSPDYATARERFRARATAAGARLSSYPVPASGYRDDALTVDVAELGHDSAGPKSRGPCVVVSSGLHGVEGFFGSAIQLEALAQVEHGAISLDATRLVLVHALNPYGFAARRRTSEENVDLNRNFLGAEETYRGAPVGYAELETLLNPPTPPSRWELFRWQALARVLRHGEPFLGRAVAIGQYEYPAGLFFGGKSVTPVTRAIQELRTTWTVRSSEVVHLDLHSGLGPNGHSSLLLAEPPEAPSVAWYRHHFGDDVQPFATDGGTAYPARGLMGRWLLENAAGTTYRFITAEFGTYSGLRVLSALRAENRAHHYGQAGSRANARAKERLVECFCPAAASWRERVLEQGSALVHRALTAGKRAAPPSPRR